MRRTGHSWSEHIQSTAYCYGILRSITAYITSSSLPRLRAELILKPVLMPLHSDTRLAITSRKFCLPITLPTCRNASIMNRIHLHPIIQVRVHNTIPSGYPLHSVQLSNPFPSGVRPMLMDYSGALACWPS